MSCNKTICFVTISNISISIMSSSYSIVFWLLLYLPGTVGDFCEKKFVGRGFRGNLYIPRSSNVLCSIKDKSIIKSYNHRYINYTLIYLYGELSKQKQINIHSSRGVVGGGREPQSPLDRLPLINWQFVDFMIISQTL